ncbi:MAG: hypothetical protein EBY22_15910, partial [Gammaproteobacteria bacterium]|nr:hypothetical protein [Gammaproteobacteria bacterium]
AMPIKRKRVIAASMVLCSLATARLPSLVFVFDLYDMHEQLLDFPRHRDNTNGKTVELGCHGLINK